MLTRVAVNARGVANQYSKKGKAARLMVQAKVVEWAGVALWLREMKWGAAVQGKSSEVDESSGAGTNSERQASKHMPCHLALSSLRYIWRFRVVVQKCLLAIN